MLKISLNISVKNQEKEIENLNMGRKKKIKKLKRAKKQKKVVIKKLVAQNTLKTNDVKIQIKKVKKQPNEKKLYNVKDYVVYPKHGVGKIISIDKAKMGDIDITF